MLPKPDSSARLPVEFVAEILSPAGPFNSWETPSESLGDTMRPKPDSSARLPVEFVTVTLSPAGPFNSWETPSELLGNPIPRAPDSSARASNRLAVLPSSAMRGGPAMARRGESEPLERLASADGDLDSLKITSIAAAESPDSLAKVNASASDACSPTISKSKVLLTYPPPTVINLTLSVEFSLGRPWGR